MKPPFFGETAHLYTNEYDVIDMLFRVHRFYNEPCVSSGIFVTDIS